jgi:hypothetical protein
MHASSDGSKFWQQIKPSTFTIFPKSPLERGTSMARRKRSRNKGYWFRAGRGWYITEGKSAFPLRDVKGNHIKFADDVEAAKDAYARYILRAGQVSKSGLTVMETGRLHLDHAQSAGSPDTCQLRAGLLFGLCTGFPARVRESNARPAAKDRLHPRLGRKSASDLTRLHMERWINGVRDKEVEMKQHGRFRGLFLGALHRLDALRSSDIRVETLGNTQS